MDAHARSTVQWHPLPCDATREHMDTSHTHIARASIASPRSKRGSAAAEQATAARCARRLAALWQQVRRGRLLLGSLAVLAEREADKRV
eukprot:7337295-Prymnesium_polylepis.1